MVELFERGAYLRSELDREIKFHSFNNKSQQSKQNIFSMM